MALDEDEGGESVDGWLVEEAAPDGSHELTVSWLIRVLGAWLGRRGYIAKAWACSDRRRACAAAEPSGPNQATPRRAAARGRALLRIGAPLALSRRRRFPQRPPAP